MVAIFNDNHFVKEVRNKLRAVPFSVTLEGFILKYKGVCCISHVCNGNIRRTYIVGLRKKFVLICF